MLYRYLINGCLGALALIFVACSGEGQQVDGEMHVDTVALKESFAEAETKLKNLASEAVTAINDTDYEEALKYLNELLKESLNTEQLQVVKETLKEVKEAIQAKAKEAADGIEDSASKAADSIRSYTE